MARADWTAKIQAANARIVKNGRALADAVEAWATAAHEQAYDALIAAIFNAYGRLIQRTPVDTGRARAAWHIEGESNEWKPDKDAVKEAVGALVAHEMRKADNLRKADVIHIMNNVEYIMALEAGHSKQGRAFTALFLEELNAELNAACRKVSGK